MVGASLAAALARLPLQIAMVEQVPVASAGQPSFDARTVALSRSSQRILETLGLWGGFGREACPIRRIHVSEQGRLGTAVIDADQQGVPALGYVIENRTLGAALWADIGHHANVAVHCPATVVRMEPAPAAIRAWVSSAGAERPVLAKLLVIADGARSHLREAAGIGARVRPYGQTAIIGNVDVARPASQPVAYERFTPAGPLALLPAGGGRYVFVLTRRTEAVPRIVEQSDADFLGLLQREFGWRLGRFGRLGRRSVYPLELVQADAVIAPRIAVLGNAANGLHPVAGQGYNLGLRDVATLAEVIADHCRGAGHEADPGSATVLERYRDWRRRDQRNVVAFTDGLIRLFDLEFPGLGAARGAGLLAFDLLPGASTLLARETMGLGGHLTRLVRGLPL